MRLVISVIGGRLRPLIVRHVTDSMVKNENAFGYGIFILLDLFSLG